MLSPHPVPLASHETCKLQQPHSLRRTLSHTSRYWPAPSPRLLALIRDRDSICAADLMSGFVPGQSPHTTSSSARIAAPLRAPPALPSVSFSTFTILHLTPARYDFGHTPETVSGHSMPDPQQERAPLPLTISGDKGALDDAPACSAHQVQVLTCPSAGQAARRPAWAYSIHLLAQRDQGSAGSL